MALTDFYRKKIAGQPDQLIEFGTNRVLGPTEFGKGENFKEVSAPTATPTTMPTVGRNIYKPQIDTSGLNLGLNSDVSSQLPDTSATDMAQAIYAKRAQSDSESTIKDLQKQLDQIKAQQLKDIETQKAQEEANLKNIQGEKQAEIDTYDTKTKEMADNAYNIANSMLGGVSSVFTQQEVERQLKERIGLTNDIISYSKLMNDELETEASRPALFSVSQGRQTSIKQTYTSKIATAQASMQAIDGNFNLAFDIMTKGTSAVKAVTEDRISFYNIVSALYDAKEEKTEQRILDLSNDEKDAIDDLKADLEADIENIEANKDTILELMSNPDTAVVAHKAGLTLTDSPDEIAQKLNTFYVNNPQYDPENRGILKDLITKYPDAGITMNDSMEEAVNKLKTSAIYKKATGLDPQSLFDLKQQGLTLDQNGNIVFDLSNATVSDIADTIKQIESNGNYTSKGASGEYGAYQFMPKTWQSWSQQFVSETLGIPIKEQTGILDATPENQDAVAEWKIQQWVEQGYTPEQIASMWNSGTPNWEGKVGTNNQGVKYDVPAYVDRFKNTLSKNLGGATNNDLVIAQQLVNGELLINDLSSRLGKNLSESERLKYIKLATQIDPNFNPNLNKNRATFRKNWETGTLMNNRIAINTSMGHLASLKLIADNLENTKLVKYNTIKNMLKKEVGNPEIAEFEFNLNLLASEMAKIYKGGNAAPTEKEIEEMRTVMISNYSPQQFDAVFNKAAELLGSKITSTLYEYKNVMGKDPENPVIDPTKLQELIDAGIDISKIDIENQTSSSSFTNGTTSSGINYTIE
ncbi:MAG: hypothetical protein V1779_17635 [bacterium]